MNLILQLGFRIGAFAVLLICMTRPVILAQTSDIDKLKQDFNEATHDTTRSRALYLLTYEFFESSLDSALVYARSNLALINSEQYPKFRCTALSGMGTTLMYLNRYDSSQFYYEEALKITDAYDLPNQRSSLYTNFGVLFKRQGLYDEAIESYIDGLIEDERTGNMYGFIIKKINISNLYGLLGDNEKALQYGMEALAACEDFDHDDKSLIQGLLLNNIGTIHVEESRFDEAIQMFEEALAINTASDNQNEMARNLHNIGLIYERFDSTEVGLPLLLRAQAIRSQVGDDVGLVETSMQIGTSYAKLGKLDSSNYFFNEALTKAKSLGNYALISQTYQAMSDSEVLNNDFENALTNQKLSASYKDSLDKNYDREAYIEMESKYRAAQKDAQISQQDLVISKRTSQRNQYLFALIGLLFLAAFIYYRSLQNRKLSNERIKNLEQQQKLIAIDYMVQGQEEERKRIARDLHDGLGGLLSSASMQMQNIQKEIDKLSEMQLFTKAEQMIDNACKEVRRIAHDMMPSALIDLGLIDAVEDLADHIRMKDKLQVNVTANVDELELTDVQSVNLYRIVQEFCNNTIKHAAASQIYINFYQGAGFLRLELSDDGIGYDLNDPNLNRGIGVTSMESRVKYLSGSLEDFSEKGTGCKYSIEIPLTNF